MPLVRIEGLCSASSVSVIVGARCAFVVRRCTVCSRRRRWCAVVHSRMLTFFIPLLRGTQDAAWHPAFIFGHPAFRRGYAYRINNNIVVVVGRAWTVTMGTT